MIKIVTKDEMKSSEELTAQKGMSYDTMIELAGKEIFKTISSKENLTKKKIVIVCGKGNNGADGYATAKHFSETEASVKIVRVYSSDTRKVPANAVLGNDGDIKNADIILDCIYGTGFHAPADERAKELIKLINESSATVYSADIPSGCECDTGNIDCVCVRADTTVSICALKRSGVLFPGAECYGKSEVVDAGIEVCDTNFYLIDKSLAVSCIPERNANSYKGSYGNALMVVGSDSMVGAGVLAACSAERSGVGLVTVASCDKCCDAISCRTPLPVFIRLEDSVLSVKGVQTILENCKKCNTILIGCGLGQNEDTAQAVFSLIESVKKPVILDADGINAVSRNINVLKKADGPVILTPHSAEMARLCKTTTEKIEADRISFAKSLSASTGAIIVLKGSKTLIASPDGRIFANILGNNGMAKGGSGDTLSGIITALAAQQLNSACDKLTAMLKAAILGVYLHALSGDFSADRLSVYSMTPTDIIENLPKAFLTLT